VLVGPANDEVVRPLFTVRAKKEKRCICLLGDFLEFLSVLEGMHFVLTREKGAVGATQRTLY
jgi:hypothetical protein